MSQTERFYKIDQLLKERKVVSFATLQEELGVSRATLDAATRNLEPDLSLPDLVIPGKPEAPARGQAEFVQTPAEYLREATFNNLAAQGRKLLVQHQAALKQIEEQFGVPGPIILAIWGRETSFGTYKLPHDAVRVLATQAFTGKRKASFDGKFRDVPTYRRAALLTGNAIAGPALIEEHASTTVLMPGDRMTVDAYGNLVISVAGAK